MKDTFHIGQLVRISSPSLGSADRRIYCVVSLITQEQDDRVYRIKNAIGIERLVKAKEIEPAALTAVP